MKTLKIVTGIVITLLVLLNLGFFVGGLLYGDPLGGLVNLAAAVFLVLIWSPDLRSWLKEFREDKEPMYPGHPDDWTDEQWAEHQAWRKRHKKLPGQL